MINISKLTNKTFSPQNTSKYLRIFIPIFVVVFMGYHYGLTLKPNLSYFNFSSQKNINSNLACSVTEENSSSTVAKELPIYSEAYRDKLSRQVPSTNLVLNPKLLNVNPYTQFPYNYSPNDNDGVSKYSYRSEENTNYLHIDLDSSEFGEVKPSWLMDEIPVNYGSYGYSFNYRSNQQADVSIEYQLADNSYRYEGLTQVNPSENWQNFNGHFNIFDAQIITMRLIISIDEVGYLDTTDYSIYSIPSASLESPMISITFDDGWESVYTEALPILDQYSILTTQYVVSEYSTQGTQGYMNVEQLKSLSAKGHEIASHSLKHCDLTTLNDENLNIDSIKSQELLENEGFSLRTFAYPYGNYSETTQKVISKDFQYIRTSDHGFNDAYFDPQNIHSKSVEQDTSIEEIVEWITYATEHKLWLVLIYHKVDNNGEYSLTSTEFSKQIKLIRDSGIEVLPVSKAADRINR